MRYDAVIFDLFGTLVPTFEGPLYERCIREMAAAVGIAAADMERLWLEGQTVLRRSTGGYPSQAACIREICGRLGLTPTQEAVRRAVDARRRLVRRSLVPRPDAVDTLQRLGEAALKRGMMSVCSREVPELWPGTPMAPLVDAALFSCTEGLTKPDPRFYGRACERLGVPPRRCLYVGDGPGDELNGARRVGMDAVLICVPQEAHIILQRPEARDWDGPTVHALHEVLQRLD
jgi:putative hydrolase of the HAD superfamily